MPMQRSARGHLLLCFVCIGLLSGCATPRPPQLVDTLGAAMDQTGVQFKPDFRTLAPIIVAASVLENRTVKSVPALRLPDVLLELHEVRCRTEHVLRGEVPSEFVFYYFIESASSKLHNPFYKIPFKAEAGRRYLFFLGKEHGTLRSIGDIGAYSVELVTGRHPRFPTLAQPGDVTNDRAMEAAVDLLLTVGEEPSLPALAHRLVESAVLADGWDSRLHTFLLVHNLLAQTEPVGPAACLLLADYYVADRDCLRHLQDDPNQAPDVRQRAKAMLDSLTKSNEAAQRRLEGSGGLEFPVIGRPDSRKRLFEELQIQLHSEYLPMQKTACVAIQRFFPGRPCTNGQDSSANGNLPAR